MKRDLGKLEDEEFDLLIVGGGIYGATTAREAALRGLKVALIERGDFGHATSSNSLKIIHGGLRYLQHGDFRRMRRSIRARSSLLRIAPHLVDPIKLVMPTYGHFFKGREVMTLALAVNDIVSWDRNRLLSKGKNLPQSRTVSKTQCLQYLPDIEKKGLTGAAIWYDCIANNTERLTLEFVLAADHYGACVANYVEAKQPILKGNSVIGVRAKDRITGQGLEICTKFVVNATGPWISKFLKIVPKKNCLNVGWAKAVNIFVKKSLTYNFVAGIAGKEDYRDTDLIIKKGKRLFFCLPWKSGSIIGTTYKRYSADPGGCRVSEQDIIELLDEINFGYPTANLTLDDVSFCHVGLVPIIVNTSTKDRDVQLVKRSLLYDHEQESQIKGIVTLNGVKYTTAVELAKDTVDLINKKLGFKKYKRTSDPPLPGAEDISISPDGEAQTNHCSFIEAGTINHLKRIYGSRYRSILDIVDKDCSLVEQIWNGHPTIQAEVIHAIREEMAQYLSDVVMRRTELGSSGYPGHVAIVKCAEIMSTELNWDEKRLQLEIDSVQTAFKVFCD